MTPKKQTVNAHPGAKGCVAVYDGAELTYCVWAWDVSAVLTNPKGPGSQILLRSGTTFRANVSPGGSART
jgi:hypothetical protein